MNQQRFIREKADINSSLSNLISYAVAFLHYQDNVRSVSEKIASRISAFVKVDQVNLENANIPPLVFLIVLTSFIPVCVILIKNISSSMEK